MIGPVRIAQAFAPPSIRQMGRHFRRQGGHLAPRPVAEPARKVFVGEVDLGFRVNGRIASIAVDEGAKVTQGQLLATLDAATLDSRIAQAARDAGFGLVRESAPRVADLLASIESLP